MIVMCFETVCRSFRRQATIICFTLVIITSFACSGNRKTIPAAPILLFNGTGVSVNDVAAIETILVNSHLNYATVNSTELNAMSRLQLLRYRLLIMPGGNFINMGNSLTAATAANVLNSVQHGLNYLGVCAGGFLAGNSAYYNGFNLTTGVTFGFYSAENKGVHKAAVAISSPNAPTLQQYWEDGPALSGWGMVVAKYPDGTPAVTEGKCGSGFVVLAGIHAEAPEDWRRGMLFTTPVIIDNAFAASLIHAALHGTSLPHY